MLFDNESFIILTPKENASFFLSFFFVFFFLIFFSNI
jgi:hypothetical protein